MKSRSKAYGRLVTELVQQSIVSHKLNWESNWRDERSRPPVSALLTNPNVPSSKSSIGNTSNLKRSRGWTHWLAIATIVHNNHVNTTIRLLPNQILFGYNPTLNSDKILQTHNALVESQVKMMTKNRANAIQVLNKVANQKGPPPSQF